ncbi:uncharacterized protein LOC112092159 [Morus notabilis]|uniref:uncharacterized protein LOC112092159 n=1 Tax=Morus notabilis TaxID=981085 RepID=UPI000CED714C|nr:uncharacterized protein LOC112092159 [Morus notabilis]
MTLKKGSLSLDEYLKKFKSVCDSLAAIKKPINETKKVSQLARGLGPKYQDFRTAMLTKPPYPTYHQFVLSLQAYERMLNSNTEEQEITPRHDQAFVGQRERGRGRGGGRFSSRGRGFNPAARYSSNSHQNSNFNGNKNNQRAKNSNWKQTPQGESITTCQICGKFNHIALKCWNRFDHSFQPEDHLPKALAAMSLKNGDDPNLYVDSGATTHMLNDTGGQNTC